MHRVAFALLWMYAFTLPWDHMLDFGEGIGEISRVFGVLSMGAAIGLVLASGSLRKPARQHLLAAGLLVTIVASWFWSVDQDATARSIRTCVQTMVVMWTVWQAAPTIERVRSLLFAYVMGCYVSCASTINDFLSAGLLARGRRFKADGWNENDLAVALALAIPMSAYLAITTRRTVVRCACWAYMLVGPIAIALTASRAGAVVAGVALCAAVMILMCGNWRVRLVTVSLAVSILCALATFVPTIAWERIASMTAARDMNDRVPVWERSLRFVADNPYRPLGAGASSVAIGGGYVSHNAFLSVLLDDGIFGLMFFLGVLAVTASQLRGLPRLERCLWWSLLLCWTIGAFTLSWEQVRITWFLFACACAAAHCGDHVRIVAFPGPESVELPCVS